MNRILTNPVAPFTGAWIEIMLPYWIAHRRSQVAPFTGAWIEIDIAADPTGQGEVAPFTGAWIEIMALRPKRIRRS